ncbi:MAG: insulinase family protein [Prevotella sp.]|nr:insulinase family protein [Candidatus Prevotella equi]
MTTFSLPSGLRIIHSPSDSAVVYCGYAINAGSRHEQCGEEGLAHFCEHMTFKGTTKRTSLQVINALERVGGEMNAYTAKEETVYYAAVLKQHLARAVELLTDIVFHSTYPQQEIEKEKEVVCDEIDSYRDSPADLIYDDFENMIFSATDNPSNTSTSALGHNVLGTKESVRTFTTADCLRFTQREYRPERMVFYVYGGNDGIIPQIVKQIEKALATGNISKLSDNTPCVNDNISKQSDNTPNSYHQAHVMLGTAITTDIERWRMPLYIINNVLGGPAMNSRFNLSLRERRGLVYTVESLMTTYSDALLWSVYFGSDKSDSARCIRLIKGELQRLRKRPLTNAALAAAKRQLKGQIALASENRESYAIDMAKQYLHRGTLRSNDVLFQRIDAVTADEIHQLLNTILTEENLCMMKY